jgi:UDP-N-acetylmuramate dehydrogenase
MLVEKNVPLQPYNTFHIVAKALSLVRVRNVEVLQQVVADPQLALEPKFILGGGSNIVLTGDVKPLVLKIEVMGKRVLQDTDKGTLIEVGAGENWHELVAWTLEQGYPGLENLAMIPGTVGASPVQNIGAYGLELQDRFHSLDAVDLASGAHYTLDAAQCAFGYRDSVFKHAAPDAVASLSGPDSKPVTGFGLRDRVAITHVRLFLPKPWKPVLGYADLERKMLETGITMPDARQMFDWVCAIRSAKLPDPRVLGNAGSFFKNPQVTREQCDDIIQREPRIVHYPLDNGAVKLAAGWLIDACGWKGKSVGNAAVYERQALVLVNRGDATGGEVMTLARAIQTSVYERFGIQLEPEPVVV